MLKQIIGELGFFFFSGGLKNLKITKFSATYPLAERLSNPTIESILKYESHPSIDVIGNGNDDSHFSLDKLSSDE